MEEKKEEGIVLHSFDYKEKERIITLFTPYSGLINLIVKRLSKKNITLLHLTTPLCRAEFIYRKGRSNLYSFVDGSILNMHLSLRSSFSLLQYGGKMISAVRKSQMPEKPAPFLYQLLISYLKHLASSKNPATLWVSFQLKLLAHEGLISLSPLCTRCKKKASSSLQEGESLCSSCSQTINHFTEKDWADLLILAHARQFTNFSTLQITKPIQEIIDQYFLSHFN